MSTLRLPGLIDAHVHMREPGALHKEDWDTGTSAALAGGITAVLAMPNTTPPVTAPAALSAALAAAQAKARCDYAHFYGAGPHNPALIAPDAYRSAGLKMYLDHTFGDLRLDAMPLWMAHFETWPKDHPIAVHAEGRSLAAAILFAELYRRSVHLCHVSRREEILLIRKAKERRLPVTCEVAHHHLFLTEEDLPAIGAGRGEVRPTLAAPADRDALWANLDVIDVFATDHAPHTLDEKDGPHPPPGFPGLETILPLLLTAVTENRLTLEDILDRMVVNPRRIFNLPEQPDTYIEIDPAAHWEIKAQNLHSRCGWTPFEGWPVTGRLRRVVLHGREAFKDGQILAPPGFGNHLRNLPTNT